jgi:hypothetical protein
VTVRAVSIIQKGCMVLLAGGLGGLTNSIVVWFLDTVRITPALGFNMAPNCTLEWFFRRIFASALWGVLFLIPAYKKTPIARGVLLSILPWLSSVLFVFPMQMDAGFFGLGFGIGAPVWTFLFAAVWGVTGTLFLSKFAANA